MIFVPKGFQVRKNVIFAMKANQKEVVGLVSNVISSSVSQRHLDDFPGMIGVTEYIIRNAMEVSHL